MFEEVSYFLLNKMDNPHLYEGFWALTHSGSN